MVYIVVKFMGIKLSYVSLSYLYMIIYVHGVQGIIFAVPGFSYKNINLCQLKLRGTCDWILENQPNCHTRPIPFYWPS